MYGAEENWRGGCGKETQGTGPLGKYTRQWNIDINTILKEMGWKGLEWIIWLRIRPGNCLW